MAENSAGPGGSNIQVGTMELVESWPVGSDFDQPDIRDTQEVWLELINKAESEILWHTFYLAHEPNTATEPIIAALKSAAQRGVRVKLLVDEKFQETYPHTLAELNSLNGIQVRPSPVGRWYGGVMHAKMLLVDGQKGFIGSQNFDWRSLTHIRELGVHFVDQSLVESYAKVFWWEWQHYKLDSPPKKLPRVYSVFRKVGDSTVAPTVSPNPLNAESALGDEYQILRLLNSSEESVKIALLSYTPVTRDGKTFYADLDNAIRSAAVRGVKVQILLSHWVEKKKTVDHLISLDKLQNVEIRACRIPLTSEGEIPFARVHHSKYLVVDNKRSWLGTSNWSRGYFRQSRNYGMIFWDGPISARLFNLFDFDWARSTELHPKPKS